MRYICSTLGYHQQCNRDVACNLVQPTVQKWRVELPFIAGSATRSMSQNWGKGAFTGKPYVCGSKLWFPMIL
jgi:hypothetical protein